jgi:hypothetical protein
VSNLLGFQSQIVTEAHRTMVRATWPTSVKVIVPGGLDAGLLREWRGRRPDGLLILRHYFPDENLAPTKWATTLNAADQIADLHPILEVPINEAHQTSPDDIARLADYSAQFVRLAADQGYRAAVGVFSEGNPSDLAWWEQFHPALRAAREHGGYLALHEYFTPGCYLDGWHSLRYRKVWDVLPEDCKIPILITECGIDGGINAPDGNRPQSGWRAYCDATTYAGLLRGYHLEMAEDAYVHGATIFLCGGYDPGTWTSFDLRDEVDLRPPLTENVTMPARWTPAKEPTVPNDITLSVPTRVSPAFYQDEGEGNYSKTPRTRTIGVIVHSTAGGASTFAAEAVGTTNWFQSREAGVSAHRVVGPAWVATCVPDALTAHHARENNADHLGVEFAVPDTPQFAQSAWPAFYYEAGGELFARWAIQYRFPLRWVTSQNEPGLICHKDSEAGKRDGKRDPTGRFDAARLLEAAQHWYAELTGGIVPPNPPTPTPPLDIAKERDALWATAERLEKGGYPWFGQGIKALVAKDKGEK